MALAHPTTLQFTLQSDDPSPTVHALRSRPTTVYRPSTYELRALHGQSPAVDWTPTEIQGPDIEDRHTLSQLARMTGNAYAIPGQNNWYDLDAAWNTVRYPSIRTDTITDKWTQELPIWLGKL